LSINISKKGGEGSRVQGSGIGDQNKKEKFMDSATANLQHIEADNRQPATGLPVHFSMRAIASKAI
jgi:hypothetical protein